MCLAYFPFVLRREHTGGNRSGCECWRQRKRAVSCAAVRRCERAHWMAAVFAPSFSWKYVYTHAHAYAHKRTTTHKQEYGRHWMTAISVYTRSRTHAHAHTLTHKRTNAGTSIHTDALDVCNFCTFLGIKCTLTHMHAYAHPLSKPLSFPIKSSFFFFLPLCAL